MTQQMRNKHLLAQAGKRIIFFFLSGLIFIVVACAPKEMPVKTETQRETTQEAKKPVKPRISVVEFDNITSMQGIETRIAVSLEQALQETKRFIVIERSEVEKILREQKLNLSKITSRPQNDKPIIPISGLDYLVTGTIASADAQLVTDTEPITRPVIEVTVKFISLIPPNPGMIQATARTISLTGQDTERMVGDLIKGINAAFPIEGQVAQVTTEKVYLNIGADDGVKVNQIFDVYQMGEEIIDPETKMSKGYVEEKVGTLAIIAVQSELSIATREAAMPAPETGWRVRSQEKAEEPPPIEMIENRIAIEAFANESGDANLDWRGEAIQGPLSTTLSKAEGFSLVEREHIGQIGKELYLQGSGPFDPRTQVKLGKLLGARYIISGSYTKFGEFWRLDARRVDVETSEVFEAEGLLGKDWDELVENLGKKLFASIEQKAQLQKSNIEDIKISSKRMREVPTAIYHLLTTSEFLRYYSLVEYTLKNTSGKQSYRLMVSTQIQGYSHAQTDTIELAPGKDFLLHHTPAFPPERLATLNTTQTAGLELQLFLLEGSNKKLIWEQTPTVTLLPYDTLVWKLEGANGQSKDLLPAIAAWVSAESAIAGRILGEAVKYSPHGSIKGYQSDIAPGTIKELSADEKQKQIRDEVKAIYQALKEHGIRYVDQSTYYPMQKGQRILLPFEALDNQSANCIDGTVLFASALLRAGIHPIIIIVPGHAFLGWQVWYDENKYDVLETTKLGATDFETALDAGWKEVQEAGIAEKLASGIKISERSTHLNIGKAMILEVRTLKEKYQIRDIPVSKEHKKNI